MADRNWTVIFLWLLFFVFLELFHYSSFLHYANGVHFVMAYVLVCAYYIGDWRAFAVALAGGVIFDALSPAPCHTPLFIVLVIAMRLLRRMFYTPDSALHKISCVIPVAAAEICLFYALSGAPLDAASAAAHIALWAAVDFLFFLLLLTLFRKRDRVVLYTMR